MSAAVRRRGRDGSGGGGGGGGGAQDGSGSDVGQTLLVVTEDEDRHLLSVEGEGVGNIGERRLEVLLESLSSCLGAVCATLPCCIVWRTACRGGDTQAGARESPPDQEGGALEEPPAHDFTDSSALRRRVWPEGHGPGWVVRTFCPLVLLAWCLVLFNGVKHGPELFDSLDASIDAPKGSQSQEAEDEFKQFFLHLADDNFPAQTVLLIERLDGGPVLTSEVKQFSRVLDKVLVCRNGCGNNLEQLRTVLSVEGYFTARDEFAAEAARPVYVNALGTATIMHIKHPARAGPSPDFFRFLSDLLDSNGPNPALYRTSFTNEQKLLAIAQDEVLFDFEHADVIGVPVAWTLLFWYCGAPAVLVAIVLPVCLLSAFAWTVFWMPDNLHLPSFAPSIIVSMGVALNIDYALFMLVRYAEELKRGLPRTLALDRSLSTAGKTIAVSGTIMLVSNGCLYFVKANTIASIGVSLAITNLVTIMANVTLLPALLCLCGPFFDALRRVPVYTFSEGSRRAAQAFARPFRAAFKLVFGSGRRGSGVKVFQSASEGGGHDQEVAERLRLMRGEDDEGTSSDSEGDEDDDDDDDDDEDEEEGWNDTTDDGAAGLEVAASGNAVAVQQDPGTHGLEAARSHGPVDLERSVVSEDRASIAQSWADALTDGVSVGQSVGTMSDWGAPLLQQTHDGAAAETQAVGDGAEQGATTTAEQRRQARRKQRKRRRHTQAYSSRVLSAQSRVWAAIANLCLGYPRALAVVVVGACVPLCIQVRRFEWTDSQANLMPAESAFVRLVDKVGDQGFVQGWLADYKAILARPPGPTGEYHLARSSCFDDDVALRIALPQLKKHGHKLPLPIPPHVTCDMLVSTLGSCFSPIIPTDAAFILPNYCPYSCDTCRASLFQSDVFFDEIQQVSYLILATTMGFATTNKTASGGSDRLQAGVLESPAFFMGRSYSWERTRALLSASFMDPDSEDGLDRLYRERFHNLTGWNATRVLFRIQTPFNPYNERAHPWTNRLREVMRQAGYDNPADSSHYHFLFGGSAVRLFDQVDQVYADTPPVMLTAVILTVLGMSVLVFQSMMLGPRLLITVGLTLGLVFGAMVVAFQDIGGSVGLYWIVPILGVPIMVGCTLDYDSFVVARIFEMRLAGLSTEAAVFAGLQETGHVITIAGLIMTVAFGSMLASAIPVVQQIGALLVACCLLDTFIIRSLLVPALMLVAVDLNWFPRKMPEVLVTMGMLREAASARRLRPSAGRLPKGGATGDTGTDLGRGDQGTTAAAAAAATAAASSESEGASEREAPLPPAATSPLLRRPPPRRGVDGAWAD